MVKSKAIDILKTFNGAELKRFRDYIRSPFHNKNKNVINLFEILRKALPEFANLDKEKIYQKLFPGKKYNDIVMRILMSDIIRLSEEFLAYTAYEKKPLEEKKFLLDELKVRGLDSLYGNNFRLAENLLRGSHKIDNFYFFDRFELETKLVDFMISRDEQLLTSSRVLKQGEHLICFSLIHLLNIAHELTSHREVLNVKFEINLVDEYLKNFNIEAFVEYLRKNDYEYFPVIAIYYYMYLAYLHHENDEYYFRLKEYTEKYLDRFDRQEQFNLFVILESTCVTKVSHGKGEFYEHLMGVYELMLEKNLYTHTQEDFFQINLFRNTFYTAVILKRFEWAEKFLEEHIDRLIPTQKENMYHYAQSLLNFERRNYEAALRAIIKVSYKFFFFKYDAKILMLKIYYELREYVPALSMIDSFSHFLGKNRLVTEVDRARFGSFLKFYRN